MGIRGLMTYINRGPKFLESYELHGEYLVIDGHSLAAQLYISSKCNCSFGGDHDKYARAVSEFFDELLKCEIVPLVVLDGGTEQKKMKTTLERTREKLRSALSYNPATQAQYKFMPMIMMVVFKSVLRQKRIKIGRCVFEADPGIAGVAKVLNCPVLSFDSDYYIFGVTYIPINALEPFVVKKSNGQGYAKRCKIYRVENLLKSFPGLDASVLPLAAILLGNDYVNKSMFKNFYRCLKLAKRDKRLYNEEQTRIHTTLKWLQNYSLNDAVAAILSKLPRKRRPKVLKIMELVINGYLVLPCDMLVPLGFQESYDRETRRKRSRRAFKFHGNIDTLESRQLWREDGASCPTDETSCSDDETDRELADSTSELLDFPGKEEEEEDKNSDERSADTWPAWFFRCHSTGDFPAYFVDLLCRRLFIFPTQIEDFGYPSAYTVSLEIIRVIDGLLVAGRRGNVPGLTYVTREGTNLVRRRLEDPPRATETTQFPALSQLADTDMSLRRRIIDDTLGIRGGPEFSRDIPPEWRLYVATISYWVRKCQEPPCNSCHLYAILFTMLFGIVDKKIGYHRSSYNLQKRYGGAIAEIVSKRKVSKPGNREKRAAVASESLLDALDAVTADDCLLAASLLISNYSIDPQLVDCPRKFNAAIVHGFSQFQACLRHAIHLNALLGYPYAYPIVAELYNGTMLYNLYVNFAKRSSIDAYIAVLLDDSPSLLNVIKLLVARVRSILDDDETRFIDGGGKNTKKRRKRKKKKEGKDVDETMMLDDEENMAEARVESTFEDPQNPFAVLRVSA